MLTTLKGIINQFDETYWLLKCLKIHLQSWNILSVVKLHLMNYQLSSYRWGMQCKLMHVLNPHQVWMSVPTPVLRTGMQSHPGHRFGPAESPQVCQDGCRVMRTQGAVDVKEAVLELGRVKCWGNIQHWSYLLAVAPEIHLWIKQSKIYFKGFPAVNDGRLYAPFWHLFCSHMFAFTKSTYEWRDGPLCLPCKSSFNINLWIIFTWEY